jgi:hypothetical protein
VGICCADLATPLYQQKFALSSETSGGRSVGIFRLRNMSRGVLVIIHNAGALILPNPDACNPPLISDSTPAE